MSKWFSVWKMFFELLSHTTDGYTVSDVVMYWRNNNIRGVKNAELPQFTILGYFVSDRVVKKKFETFFFLIHDLELFSCFRILEYLLRINSLINLHRKNWQLVLINDFHCPSNFNVILDILFFKPICQAFSS